MGVAEAARSSPSFRPPSPLAYAPLAMRTSAAALLALALLSPGLARADGAFPVQLQVFLPTDQPNRIVLITNFGILRSDDSGASWSYLCEALAGQSSAIGLYQFGPDETLLGDSYGGLVRTQDLGCSWSVAGGKLSGSYAWDAAFDPLVPGHVLALAQGPSGGGSSAIYPSTDDAATFGSAVFAMQGNLTGIEFSQASRGVVYATGGEADAPDGSLGAPFVLLSHDGGQSWGAPIDHPELGVGILYLAGAGLSDPATAYFRWVPSSGASEELLVTHDSGQTLSSIFEAPAAMTAFVELPSGVLYVGTQTSGAQPTGLWSAPPAGDGGAQPFAAIAPTRVKCLGQRAGTLYVCGDNWADRFALGIAQDGGTIVQDGGEAYTPLLTFVQIGGLAECPGTSVQATCGTTWTALESLFGIDAGTPALDAGPSSTAPPKGCGCGAASTGPGFALLALLALVALRSRRRA